MESNDDTANAERIMFNITPKALVCVPGLEKNFFYLFYSSQIDVIKEAFEQGEEMDNESQNQDHESSTDNNGDKDDDDDDDNDVPPPREVGHNLYILAHKLAKFNKFKNLVLL
jgi:inositol 1,4,5-triphosphate receptor type 2